MGRRPVTLPGEGMGLDGGDGTGRDACRGESVTAAVAAADARIILLRMSIAAAVADPPTPIPAPPTAPGPLWMVVSAAEPIDPAPPMVMAPSLISSGIWLGSTKEMKRGKPGMCCTSSRFGAAFAAPLPPTPPLPPDVGAPTSVVRRKLTACSMSATVNDKPRKSFCQSSKDAHTTQSTHGQIKERLLGATSASAAVVAAVATAAVTVSDRLFRFTRLQFAIDERHLCTHILASGFIIVVVEIVLHQRKTSNNQQQHDAKKKKKEDAISTSNNSDARMSKGTWMSAWHEDLGLHALRGRAAGPHGAGTMHS